MKTKHSEGHPHRIGADDSMEGAWDIELLDQLEEEQEQQQQARVSSTSSPSSHRKPQVSEEEEHVNVDPIDIPLSTITLMPSSRLEKQQQQQQDDCIILDDHEQQLHRRHSSVNRRHSSRGKSRGEDDDMMLETSKSPLPSALPLSILVGEPIEELQEIPICIEDSITSNSSVNEMDHPSTSSDGIGRRATLPYQLHNAELIADHLDDEYSASTQSMVLPQEVVCRSKAGSLAHRLLSINIIVPVILIITLLVAVAAVLTSSLITSKNILVDMGGDFRTSLAMNSQAALQEIFRVSTMNMELSTQLFARNYNYTRNIFEDNNDMNGVVNIFRSFLDADPDAMQSLIVFDDGSSIIYADFRPVGYVLYVASAANNYTAHVGIYNSSTVTEPYLTGEIPNWDARAPKDSFWKQAMAYQGSPDDYILSKVFSINVGPTNVFCLSKKIFDERGQQYAVLSTVYRVKMLEERLANTSDYSFVLVTDSNGSFVASTLNYTTVLHAYDQGGDHIPISATNHTELVHFDRAIKGDYGGWARIKNKTDFRYRSPELGDVYVSKTVLSFPNQDWYVFAAWPETQWTNRIQLTMKINIGIALGVLLVSIIASLCLSIPVTRSINRIKDCFKQVREMDLDSPVIKRTLRGKFIWYEPAELQSSFRSMLLTLKSFQKYVPAYVVTRLVHKGTEASLGLKSKNCSIMFLDVKDFTTYSEILPPPTLVTIMSEIFETLSAVIQSKESNGIIDKYIGDCIMAYWQGEGHESRACQCALECRKAMQELSISFRDRSLPAMECRIGINSGNVLMGNFGSKSRFNWTIVGDNVNLASRVEELNKYYETVILVTENTARKLPADMFVLRIVEHVQVKGKENSVRIYELMKRSHEATNDDAEGLELYYRAFNLYSAAKFSEASTLFRSVPFSDTLIRIKIKQCEEFDNELKNGSSWDGIVRMNMK